MPEPLRGLTRPQARAATHAAGPLLVLGAPGAGKSLSLAGRAAWLCAAGGLDPAGVALVVATPEAARRTRRRLADRLGPGVADVGVATLPELCTRLLRAAGRRGVDVGLDPFAVPATRTERVGLLLEHHHALGLRHHGTGPARVPLLAAAVARIDRLKEGLLAAEDVAERAERDDGTPSPRRDRDREFARLMGLHDRLLAERGLVDHGGLLLALARLVTGEPHATGLAHLLVDDLQDLPAAGVAVLRALHAAGVGLTAAGDDDQATRRAGAAATRNLRDLAALAPGLATVLLERSHRCPAPVLRAAEAVVAPVADRLTHPWNAADGLGPRAVRFWRARDDRAQARAVAADVERLRDDGVDLRRVAVLVPSVREDARAVALALEERDLPVRVGGAGAFLDRAEVRDVLAWLRLLVAPADAAAVARALARPPVELRPADLARCSQVARRRRVDLVSALPAARDAPQVSPDARERIGRFLDLHRATLRSLDEHAPDRVVADLVRRLGLRDGLLLGTTTDVAWRLRDLGRLGDLAARHLRCRPQGTARDFAHWLGALAEAGGDPTAEVDGGPFAGAGALPEPAPGAEPWAPEDDAPTAGAAVVRVLPLGAAAELELDHVYVVGLAAGRLPAEGPDLVDPLPVALVGEPGGGRARETSAREDEARRALYVAMTRARTGVVLAHAATSPDAGLREAAPAVQDALRAAGVDWEEHDEQPVGPEASLSASFRALRDELLADVTAIGARLGELSLDTDLDLAHGTTRFLELAKVAALMRRAEGLSLADALPAINAAIEQEATALQRELLRSSGLDDDLLAAEGRDRDRRRAAVARAEPTLAPFLPRRGEGLVLSAGDLEVYRACPLRWKFRRVFRIPSEQTTAQRFGILVHQVLERGVAQGTDGAHDLRTMLDAGWRRAGLAGVPEEPRLRGLAEHAMDRFAERAVREPGRPLWLERSFEFRMGPHALRGRVDRVDRMPDGSHELVDYKTGRPRSRAELHDDVQLQLYAVAAREAWGLRTARQAYHYVLDDEKVALPADDLDRDWIGEVVAEAAGRILDQDFAPTPSHAACGACDYRLTCPAAER